MIGCGNKSSSGDDDDNGGAGGEQSSGGSSARGGGSASGGRLSSSGGSAGRNTEGGNGGLGDAPGKGGSRTDGGMTGLGGSGAQAGDGAGGSAASAGDAGASGTPPITCTLMPIESDFNDTWDVAPAMVTVTVTVNGAAMPDSPDTTYRASVRFENADNGTSVGSEIAPTGPGTAASVLLFPGTYDVTLATTSAATLVGMPPGGTVLLAKALEVSAGTSLSYDVKPLELTGTVTLDGHAMPDSSATTYRASVELRDTDSGGTYSSEIAATGPGTFSAFVFAGTYDVSLKTTTDADLIGMPPGATVRLASGAALTDATPVVYDTRVVAVSGTVTVNGATMPDSPGISYRGDVQFRNQLSGDVSSGTIQPTGPGTFSTSLFAGDYQATFVTASSTGLVGLPPSATAVLGSALHVADAMPLAFDVKTAQLAGTVTVNGAAMPDSPGATYRGYLSLRDSATGSSYSGDIGPTGAGSFAIDAFAGTYGVTFTTTSGQNLVGLPQGASVKVDGELVVSGSNASLSYDVKPIDLSGTLTLNGGAMPDSPSTTQRGWLSFRDKATGQTYSGDVPAQGAATFATRLFAAKYDADFHSSSDKALVGMPPGAVARVASNVDLGDTSALAYDLKTVTVSGTLTEGGAALPDSPLTTYRGDVAFVDRVTNDSNVFEIAPTGAATFSGLLFAGAYNVSFNTTNAGGLVALPPGATTALEIGCLPEGACTHDVSDVSGVWDVKIDAWGEINATLTQSKDAITGSFTGDYDGVFTSIVVQGNEIRLDAPSYGNCFPFGIIARLETGCTMSGVAFCDEEANTEPAAGTR
jgi:hypothetical protein